MTWEGKDFPGSVEMAMRMHQVQYERANRLEEENKRLKEWIESRSEYRARALKAEILLDRIIDEVEDPWFYEAYEGLNDGCVFCGGQCYSTPVWENGIMISPHIKWHEPTCLWFDIHAHVGRTVSDTHRKPKQK